MKHTIQRTPSALAALCILTVSSLRAQCPSFEVTPEWLAKIEAAAPAKPQAKPRKKRTVLVFSLMPGFKHWCTPHTAGMVRILGEKSGAYDAVASDDISHFKPENIKKYDVIVLNNTCTKRPNRHIFFDVLQDMEKAKEYEKSLVDHIARGHGLVAIHGAIVTMNNSEAFGNVLGGAFDYHPKQQTVTGKLVDPDHPITSAFEGKPLVHFDEPYYFNKAYLKYDFLPLLEMELAPDGPDDKRAPKQGLNGKSIKRYISWIKPHEKGRVFYCSPSHNAQSFEQPALLRFILNGIQYAAGDLVCDDTPLAKN